MGITKAQSDNDGSAASAGPPPLVKPVEPFDLASYLGEWYVQAQAPNSYQPMGTLYCVKATYSLEDGATTPQRISVNNQARTGYVTGPTRGGLPGNNDASFRRSCAATTKENLPSDLASCQTFSRVRIGSCTTTVTLARRSSREVRRRKLAKMAFARVLVAPSSIQTETGKACGCSRVRLCLRRIA